MDEAERAEVPLAEALRASVPEELAAHWQKTLTFLAIATEQWPRILDELGLMAPVARQVRLLARAGRGMGRQRRPITRSGLPASRASARPSPISPGSSPHSRRVR